MTQDDILDATDAICGMVVPEHADHYHNFCMAQIMVMLDHAPTRQCGAMIAESTALYVCAALGLTPDTGLDSMMKAVRTRYAEAVVEETKKGETVQ